MKNRIHKDLIVRRKSKFIAAVRSSFTVRCSPLFFACRSSLSLARYSLNSNKGFSLLETLLVIAILSVLAVGGAGFYRSFIKSAEIDSTVKSVASDLKFAQAKSMNGENGLKWGVHFVNGASDYYEVFSTPTDYGGASTTVETTNYLPASISFTDPSVSSTILFDKIRGTVSATSTVTIVSFDGENKTVTTTPAGKIYY